MNEYRRDARQLVTAALGIVDASVVEEEGDETLDIAIAKAMRCLMGAPQHRRTFYLAFSCKNSWEEVQNLMNKFREDALDLEAVKKYGREALRTMTEAASNDPNAISLQRWAAEYRRALGRLRA